ncbi:hypothetical protein, partial [Nocardia abscessus]
MEAPADRQRRTIAETFTGDPLGSVPVGTAADVAAAMDRA